MKYLDLVYPAVGAGRWFAFVFVDVHVEFFAIALVFPVGNLVAKAEEIRIAAEVEIADEHPAKMAEVADFVVAEAEGAEERQRRHNGDDRAKTQGDWDRKEIDPAIREQDRAGNHDSEDRAGSPNGGNVVGRFTPESGNGANDDVENACANASQKIVAKKTVPSPNKFEFAAKHPQHQHVDQDVPNVVDAVKEKIGKRLPNAETRNDTAGNQAEPHFELVFRKNAAEIVDEELKKKYREVGDDEKLHTRSDVEIEAEAVVPDVRASRHTQISLRVKGDRVKHGSQSVGRATAKSARRPATTERKRAAA
jgi:hypothetical protein